MPDILAFSEMDPEQRVRELHAWIATHANGGEGIIAALLPGLGATPLISSRRAVMEQARGAALRAVELSKGRGDAEEVVSVRLVTFRRVEE